ncbi:MAG: AAA family ATPase, partial [Bacteroidota bacterium]
NQDLSGADRLIVNLKDYDDRRFKSPKFYQEFLETGFAGGKNQLVGVLNEQFGLSTTAHTIRNFLRSNNIKGNAANVLKKLADQYTHLYGFLEAFIIFQQQRRGGYVHVTPNDNIIISALDKRSGVAVIIETQNSKGQLLSPNHWIISRTDQKTAFEEALIFRSQDVQDFFDADGSTEIFETQRYKLFFSIGQIAIDSLLDNTDNLLELEVVNDCFHRLHADHDIIVALSNEQEVTVVNTHRSIIPEKWPRKIVLPEAAAWVRADENLNTLFVQNNSGLITVFDITGEHPEPMAELGSYAKGFEIDQAGHLYVLNKQQTAVYKITTNAAQLRLPFEQKNVETALKNLSHLFKGESIFTRKQFARVVSKDTAPAVQQLPSAYEKAKYDFETNIEHKLAEAGTDYEALLKIKNQVAIARQNIAEELSTYADREGITLVGQRLQSAINTILTPTERRVQNLLEAARASDILHKTKGFRKQVFELDTPDAYQDILNNIRTFQQELDNMASDNSATVLSEFKTIKQELDKSFSQQITNDQAALQKFILAEIDQIETAINNTHEPRQLELLLSTHPAALELMNLLKQPFVLQNIAREKNLSPSGIQSRLFNMVEERKRALRKEIEKREADKNAAKMQLAGMVRESIDYFVKGHTGGFSDLELSENASYQQIISDISKLESVFKDVRLSIELKRKLEQRILERNRADLERLVAYKGKYAYVQNDPELYVDLDSTIRVFPTWTLQLKEKKGVNGVLLINFMRKTDREIYQPGTTENLAAGKAFEIEADQYPDFNQHYQQYASVNHSYELLKATWKIKMKEAKVEDFPQFDESQLQHLAPQSPIQAKALRCALEKKYREHLERTRERAVPKIAPEFIDSTPWFQGKLNEFLIKSKLQMMDGAGIILLSGPPGTGKSSFLKFVSSIMNREYFEHAADRWQTKNSLTTALKFGEQGLYEIPAGFTRAITTPHSLVNIEEIKEWPEALRKSLNPFFAGSKLLIAQDGSTFQIGDNILLCAAANLGSMYREMDEPFTADFWSRIEVVEYDYAPEQVDKTYMRRLHYPDKSELLTMQDLCRRHFNYEFAPTATAEKATFYTKQFLEFILLPKADEHIKRNNLKSQIDAWFSENKGKGTNYNPEEAAKIALRRMRDFQGYEVFEFFELFDHFVNGAALRTNKLIDLQSTDTQKYEHLKFLIIALRQMEGCLRSIRRQFYSTAGQTEIEGSNREFIRCVHLLSLIGI